MATEHLPLLDSFKLPTTFFPTGVVHSHPGSAVEEVWTDISVIGHGGQGIVYLQQLQSGPTRLLRAVKLLSSDLRPAHIKSELNMMMAVRDHEDLFVTLFGWFENQNGTVYLAMEYAPHGDLAAYIKTTPDGQRDAQGIARQLLLGLSVLHNRNICHRDLKPQNVLLASLVPLKVKLADFGISKSTAGTDLRTRVGTARYMAPELLGLLPTRLRQGVMYTTAVDMWALGFIVHELLTGRTPFLESSDVAMSTGYPTVETEAATTDMRLMLQFCDGHAEFPRELLHATEHAAVRFIETLVVADPRARVSAERALLDPWIMGQRPPLNSTPAEDWWKTQLSLRGPHVDPGWPYNPRQTARSALRPISEPSEMRVHAPLPRIVVSYFPQFPAILPPANRTPIRRARASMSHFPQIEVIFAPPRRRPTAPPRASMSPRPQMTIDLPPVDVRMRSSGDSLARKSRDRSTERKSPRPAKIRARQRHAVSMWAMLTSAAMDVNDQEPPIDRIMSDPPTVINSTTSGASGDTPNSTGNTIVPVNATDDTLSQTNEYFHSWFVDELPGSHVPSNASIPSAPDEGDLERLAIEYMDDDASL